MGESTYQRNLRGDMRRLEALLEGVAKSDEALWRRITIGEDLQLLDLACGACNEAETLANFFGGRNGNSFEQQNLRFVGMDIREREIADATARFNNAPHVDFEFIRGDATKLENYKQLPDAFDVIFVRHQNLWDGKRTWEEIYHKTMEKLSPNGRLIITSYFDREHSEAIEVIENQGGELLINQANEKSRCLELPGKSVDRHVAILKREG